MENPNPKFGFNCKKLIIVCSIVLAVSIVISSVIFVSDIFKYNTGVVTRIFAKAIGNNEVELKITYFLSMGGCSVREVPLDEGEYIGDGMIDYNGNLGKYRIMIDFGDMEPHESFKKQMNEDGIFEIKNSIAPMKAKIAHPSDHGFVLYLGSDMPISVESKDYDELSALCGTVRIPICMGNTE